MKSPGHPPRRTDVVATSRRRAIAVLLLASLFAPVSAATFCVHDGVELEAALASASTNGQDDNIKLAPGAYTPSGASFAYHSSDLHGLTISGGYAAPPGSPPCGIFLGGAQWSVLDGAGSKRLLDTFVQGASAAPAFVHDLSLAHGAADSSAVLNMSGSSDWTGDLILENVSVHANTAGSRSRSSARTGASSFAAANSSTTRRPAAPASSSPWPRIDPAAASRSPSTTTVSPATACRRLQPGRVLPSGAMVRATCTSPTASCGAMVVPISA